MRVYTDKDEDEMLERYSSGKWIEDEVEFSKIKLDLSNADTSARFVAMEIELMMASRLIRDNRADKVVAVWIIEHKEKLTREFGRGKMLKVMQEVIEYHNQRGYKYIEEIQVLQYLWEIYK